MQTFIDLSLPLTDHMPVYPGDDPPRLTKVRGLMEDGFNNFNITTSMHTGTHIDGPMHLTPSQKYLEEFPAEQFIGEGCILDVSGKSSLLPLPEYGALIRPRSIVILYTGMSRFFGTDEYFSAHPIVSRELAQVFVDKEVKMVCLDFPSPDRHPYEIHKFLLGHHVLIAENLTNCDKLLSVRTFEIFALPLKIRADSSPARIIARIRE
jgi:kynurenine formamidase